ncbi:MAG: Glu/Leu/Phe/Val dehydrogenase dimerization domain-containing protein [Myxococcota bacterium]
MRNPDPSTFGVFSEVTRRDHEQVVYCHDPASGLRAIIAIHNSTLGPALGGCRMFPYANENDALIDVLRLSRGMTYKAAVSGLDLGGGKCVVIGDPKKDKSELLWRALGRFIEGLGGRYITAEDSGTTMNDMELIQRETRHVVGISRSLGGSGDPSPVTALGVFQGIRATVEEHLGKNSLSGLKVAVQGVGHVGYHLVGHLVTSGCQVTVCDVDIGSVKAALDAFPGVEAVEPDLIYDVDCDIFAPCAMGGIVNADTIPRLTCSVIAGAANNQLNDEKADATALLERGIFYAPDFVVNAGGLINVSNELGGYNQERALKQADGIYDICRDIFRRAKDRNVPVHDAANDLAMERINSLHAMRRTYTGHPGGGRRPRT